MAPPNQTLPCKFVLEQYLLLQEQRQELSNHLQQIHPREQSASSVSTRSSSASSQHTASSKLPFLNTTRQHARARARCSGWHKNPCNADSLDTIVDEETLDEISAKEQRLFDVNESIKRALTELLNTDAVRGNKSMRMWAQARLMETEKELRSGRRRRGLP